MLLSFFVHVESILVRRLDLAERTPELVPRRHRRRRRRRRRDSQLSSPAVTFTVDVGLQRGITIEFDHAQLASEESACEVKYYIQEKFHFVTSGTARWSINAIPEGVLPQNFEHGSIETIGLKMTHTAPL